MVPPDPQEAIQNGVPGKLTPQAKCVHLHSMCNSGHFNPLILPWGQQRKAVKVQGAGLGRMPVVHMAPGEKPCGKGLKTLPAQVQLMSVHALLQSHLLQEEISARFSME